MQPEIDAINAVNAINRNNELFLLILFTLLYYCIGKL